MAIGFIMGRKKSSLLDCISSALLFLSMCGSAAALEVQVIGLTQGKAVVVIDGKRPRTLSLGESSPEGVKLIASSSESAVLAIAGKRQTVGMGHSIAAIAAPSTSPRVTLTADSRGHFVTLASINGATVRFIVDTGATQVAMSADDARRAGVHYTSGERGSASTANGMTSAYQVKLDNVKLGDITLTNIDGIVLENNALPAVLLGMSFLGRLEMQREGSSMTLIKKY